MQESAQRKQMNIEESIKLVTTAVFEITTCLEKITFALTTLDIPARV